jgi:hypothetical protein
VPVRVTQRNDGVVSGTEFVIPALPGETDAQTLTRKTNSHTAHGWTVAKQGQTRATATKNYPAGERAKDAKLPAQIVREFRIA